PSQLQQVAEEKAAVGAQLRAVSQTLRDTQNRCHWLEGQVQVKARLSVASSLSRDNQRDFSIEMETEEEWEALSLNPNQPSDNTKDPIKLTNPRADGVQTKLHVTPPAKVQKPYPLWVNAAV
ncbi:hypothetical protein GBF38_006612, partial [Nibea albiflora]